MLQVHSCMIKLYPYTYTRCTVHITYRIPYVSLVYVTAFLCMLCLRNTRAILTGKVYPVKPYIPCSVMDYAVMQVMYTQRVYTYASITYHPLRGSYLSYNTSILLFLVFKCSTYCVCYNYIVYSYTSVVLHLL